MHFFFHFSVPALYPQLTVPKANPSHAISAPASPRKPEAPLGNYVACDEVIVWGESTPLLKVAKNGVLNGIHA